MYQQNLLITIPGRDEPLAVMADSPDFARYDQVAAREGWPSGFKAIFLMTQFVGWAACKRLRLLSDDEQAWDLDYWMANVAVHTDDESTPGPMPANPTNPEALDTFASRLESLPA